MAAWRHPEALPHGGRRDIVWLGGIVPSWGEMNKASRGVTIRNRAKFVLAGCAMVVLAALPAPAAPVEHAAVGSTQVDVKLVIATDISLSIDDVEAQIQRQGIADLFLDPEVIRAIQSGPLGVIAVSMLDWAGYGENKVVLDWTLVNDKASAAALSAKIRGIGRIPGKRTSISDALERAFAMIEESDGQIVAARRVVDVSGDGPNNDGYSLQELHDKIANNGITVNGLPIMDENSDGYFADLDKYYGACVVSGKGSFLIVVKHFNDFGPAMRRKLVVEISQDESQIKQALRDLDPNPLLKQVAAGSAVAQNAPRLGPIAKTYPGGCDKYGGWSHEGG
jgi:hypothetical protein